MNSIAAVMVSLAEDDAAPALAALDFVDEVHVFVESEAVARSVAGRGRHVHVIDRPASIEVVGERLIGASTAEWTLLVDPDELIETDGHRLRDVLADLEDGVAACDVAYELRLLGASLSTTFAGLRKTKLVRSGRCRWPSRIHALPQPIDPLDQVVPLDPSVITVASDLGADVPRRLHRHARWAAIEAEGARARPVDVDRLLDALQSPLDEYLGQRNGAADGTGGVANALLHVAKEIQKAVFEASIHGFAPIQPGDHRRIAQLLDSLKPR
jgi:hypothetical protein